MPTSKVMQHYADDYGYQLAFLKSDPGLYNIFLDAVANKLDATRFIAKVKASPWYKTHGEAYRQNLALKTTDPASWKQKVDSQYHLLGDMGRTMGASFTSAQLRSIAEQSILMGWNDNQIRDVLAQRIKSGSMVGDAASIAQKLKLTAYRNGFKADQSSIDYWTKKIASGEETIEAVQQRYRQLYGARLAPGFAKELQGGMDLYDIASPYMQSMAQTLELNPSDIDLFDPTIRKALSSSESKDGKPEPGSTPMWQFEQNLRADPRFMKTKQAQDQTMAVGHKILQDFGMVS